MPVGLLAPLREGEDGQGRDPREVPKRLPGAIGSRGAARALQRLQRLHAGGAQRGGRRSGGSSDDGGAIHCGGTPKNSEKM